MRIKRCTSKRQVDVGRSTSSSRHRNIIISTRTRISRLIRRHLNIRLIICILKKYEYTHMRTYVDICDCTFEHTYYCTCAYSCVSTVDYTNNRIYSMCTLSLQVYVYSHLYVH